MCAKRNTDPIVKKVGDEILRHINFIFDNVAGDDDNLRFKLNRWVFQRLQLLERRKKEPIKKQLFTSGIKACQASRCKTRFLSLKNVEIHRKNNSKDYSADNCLLVCKECHEELQ